MRRRFPDRVSRSAGSPCDFFNILILAGGHREAARNRTPSLILEIDRMSIIKTKSPRSFGPAGLFVAPPGIELGTHGISDSL
ncbi:MAG: hypothetical protein JW925_11440 [Syntrophaceae bacterium]|nr:hypothetical protein [Syntrophaceae bacterium]